jgi:phage terminase large subunit GpA-like protein
MTPVKEWLAAVLDKIYQPLNREKIWEWAEREIFLEPRESQEHYGPYDSSLTPYTRLVMQFATDPDWREFILAKSSQSGFTLAILIIVAYFVPHRPRNIIYAIDSGSEAWKISKTRLQPLLRNCRETAAQIEAEDDVTNMTFFLRGLTIYLMGAYSAGALANKSAGLVIADELDKHPEQPQGEANSIDLLRQRLKKVEDGKLIAFSTPKSEYHITWQEYLTGSRHKCFLPCPHCGGFQELVLEQLRYQQCRDLAGDFDLGQVLTDTFYECEHCHASIKEEHKPAMLERLEWRATNFGQDEHKPIPRKMSANVSDLYSTFSTSTWGQIAIEYIQAQKSPAALQNFNNGRLGLPSIEKRSEIKRSDLLQLCGSYEHGHCPVQPFVITLAADVQADVKKWVKVAWLNNGAAYVVDYGMCLSYDELLIAADDPVIVDDWQAAPEEERINPVVFIGLVDEGHDHKGVRDFCQGTEGRFFPCKGRGGIQVRDIVEEKTHFIHNGQPLTVYHFSDDDFKADLYLGRIGKARERMKAEREGTLYPIPPLYFPKNPDAEFLNELCAERRELVMKKGRPVMMWIDPTEANDYGDALKMNLVAWYRLQAAFLTAKTTA